MDAKQRLGLKSLMALALTISTFISCEKKKEKPKIIDDDNSFFAGKACYGEAIKDQYLMKWSDNSYSTFYGSKQQLEAVIQNQNEKVGSLGVRTIVQAEQNRFINNKSFNSEIFNLSQNQVQTYEGSFWQIWGQEDIEVSSLWDKQIVGNNMLVAVVDNGVDITHPALVNRIAINEAEIPDNDIDDDGNGLVDDYMGYDFDAKVGKNTPSGHGTHVAGIIAAEPKGNPMSGMAPAAKILPIDIMNGVGGTLESAINGIKYAESRGAKIINASWGGTFCSDSLREVISDLDEKGILFISAAGNSGVDLQTDPEFPAAFNLENQLNIGATVQSGLMATFSNYSYTKVHILAPGHQILSSVPGGWGISSGTSMAAPFVTGLAALLWSAHPEAKMIQIKQAILQSVKDPKEYNPVVSKGRVNAPQALEKLEGLLKNQQLH